MKRILASLLAIVFLLGSASSVRAASFELQSQAAANPGVPFRITLAVSASSSINAIFGTISLPQGLLIKSVSNANSILGFWVDAPTLGTSSSPSVSFSGIIPGGFKGQGTVLSMMAVSYAPDTTFHLSAASVGAYLNTSQAVLDRAVALPSSVYIVPQGSSTPQAAPTVGEVTSPPEQFLITLSKEPLIDNGAWSVIFNTQGKATGIDHYEVAEVPPGTTLSTSSPEWKTAESPYVLTDQGLHSTIYVKAVGSNGVVTIESYPAAHPLTVPDKIAQNRLFLFTLLLIVLIALFFLIRFARKKDK